MADLKMYCVYHDETALKENQLQALNSDYYRLYYTKKGHKNSLDNIQQYICEFTAQYCILKNQIKSDYVGFCQYHRQLNCNFEKIIEKDIPVFGIRLSEAFNTNELNCWALFKNKRFINFLVNDFDEYIKANYKETDIPYKIFIAEPEKPIDHIVNEIYIAKWEVFEEVVGFIAGFLDYFDKKHNLNKDPEKYHKIILTDFIDDKLQVGFMDDTTWWLEKNGTNFWRVIANFIELIEGFYLGKIYEMNKVNETYYT